MVIGGLCGLLLYGFFVFFSEYGDLVVKLTVFLAVSVVLGVVVWAGYEMATTPLPEPLDFSMEDTEAEPGG